MSYKTTSNTPELIIDPGHGGKDPGGGSNNFFLEKNMVLDISLYQFKRYKELGIPVAITRTTDVYISPAARTKLVRDSKAKFCHSNHINAGGGDGAEVIRSIYDSTNMPEIIAEEIRKEGQNVRRVFTRRLPSNSKRDYYFMIRDTGSVNTNIIEYGFADSKQDDVQQLINHWQDYAEAVVRAYCKFRGHKYVAPNGKVEKPSTSKPSNSASKPSKPATSTSDVKGKRLVSIHKDVKDPVVFRNKPSWDAKDVIGTIKKGQGFPEIVEKVKVGKDYQYKVKNSKGAVYYVTANPAFVKVEGASTSKSASKPSKPAASKPSAIKSIGKIKIIGVKSAAIVMDKPDRKNAKNIGTITLGKTIDISGSVQGKNSDSGYWEIIFNGKRAYVTGKYGKKQ